MGAPSIGSGAGCGACCCGSQTGGLQDAIGPEIPRGAPNSGGGQTRLCAGPEADRGPPYGPIGGMGPFGGPPTCSCIAEGAWRSIGGCHAGEMPSWNGQPPPCFVERAACPLDPWNGWGGALPGCIIRPRCWMGGFDDISPLPIGNIGAGLLPGATLEASLALCTGLFGATCSTGASPAVCAWGAGACGARWRLLLLFFVLPNFCCKVFSYL
mmetsp:Transcript_14942/g.41006  ORF Transcript_14942/g.41006 Transcript_14942/m.41006 type:complete len:212 (-) Transcript_14942:1590-2225(-)